MYKTFTFDHLALYMVSFKPRIFIYLLKEGTRPDKVVLRVALGYGLHFPDKSKV